MITDLTYFSISLYCNCIWVIHELNIIFNNNFKFGTIHNCFCSVRVVQLKCLVFWVTPNKRSCPNIFRCPILLINGSGGIGALVLDFRTKTVILSKMTLSPKQVWSHVSGFTLLSILACTTRKIWLTFRIKDVAHW